MTGQPARLAVALALGLALLSTPALAAPSEFKWPGWFPLQPRPQAGAKPRPRKPTSVRRSVSTGEARLPRPRPEVSPDAAESTSEVVTLGLDPRAQETAALAPRVKPEHDNEHEIPVATAANKPPPPADTLIASNGFSESAQAGLVAQPEFVAGQWRDPRGPAPVTLSLPGEGKGAIDPPVARGPPAPVEPVAAAQIGPATIDREDAEPAPADANAAIDMLARLPKPKPGEASVRMAMLEVGPAEDVIPQPVPPLAPVSSADEAECLRRLTALGVAFTPMPPIDTGGGCAVARPLAVTAVGSGVTIASPATMNCRIAEAVAIWVRDSVTPAAKAHLKAIPTKIAPGSTYACRPRNNQQGAKLSEHGRANAFDVMSIAFADRAPVEVRPWPPTSPEGRFQDAIRAESCKYFTTVLGPGDAAHSNHLHLDLAERRGGYRLCSLGEPLTAGRGEVKTKSE